MVTYVFTVLLPFNAVYLHIDSDTNVWENVQLTSWFDCFIVTAYAYTHIWPSL